MQVEHGNKLYAQSQTGCCACARLIIYVFSVLIAQAVNNYIADPLHLVMRGMEVHIPKWQAEFGGQINST